MAINFKEEETTMIDALNLSNVKFEICSLVLINEITQSRQLDKYIDLKVNLNRREDLFILVSLFYLLCLLK